MERKNCLTQIIMDIQSQNIFLLDISFWSAYLYRYDTLHANYFIGYNTAE